MQPERRRRSRRTVVAAVTLLAGLVALLMWHLVSSGDHLPYRDGATPRPAQLTKENTYSLAVPGGVRAMLRAGVPTRSENGTDVISLECTYARSGSAGQSRLDVTPESTSTKAENTVGQFVAPVTGQVRIACSGWGAMFVPDSDDRPYDWAGFAVLAATVLLTVGSALGLSELRRGRERPRPRPGVGSLAAAGEHDQVE